MTATTTSKAASNGGTATADRTAAPERKGGMARMHEEECYHLTGLVRNALNAAERLTSKAHDQAADRYVDCTGRKGTDPLNPGELWTQLSEARACVRAADDYLRQVLNAVDALNGSRELADEPPF